MLCSKFLEFSYYLVLYLNTDSRSKIIILFYLVKGFDLQGMKSMFK